MVRLKEISNGLNPSFELISGKKGYKKFLSKIGYSRTNTMPNYEVCLDNILYYDVVLSGNIIYLDYNKFHDLVLVKKITKEQEKAYKGRKKELIELILTEEFNKLG